MSKSSVALINFKPSNIHVVGVPKGGRDRKKNLKKFEWKLLKGDESNKSRRPRSPMNTKHKKNEENCIKIYHNEISQKWRF